MRFRNMNLEYLDQVVEIERDLYTLPWSKQSFLYEISDSERSYCVIGVEGSEVVCYAVAWFVTDEMHIGNIAVRRTEQGKGIGKRLLKHLLKEAGRRNIRKATLEVRVSNVRAINLYRRFGFEGIAFRKGYYADNGEDALVMLTYLDSDKSRQQEDLSGGQS